VRILLTGISTRAIAQSAIAGGYVPVTLDYFGDLDQRAACENHSLRRDFGLPYGPQQLLHASRRLCYDAVCYTASLENYPDVVAELSKAPVRLLGNGSKTLLRVRDGATLFDFAGGIGWPGPPTYSGSRLPPQPAGRWLRKPKRSGGGHDIRYWPADRPPGAGYVLQQFVPGPLCSAAFLANGEEAFVLGLTEQLIGKPELGAADFAYCGNLYPLPAERVAEAAVDSGRPVETGEPGLLAQARVLCSALAREFHLVGLNGLDFALRDGRICPLEVNPRYSAAMELMEWAAGSSLFAWHVQSIVAGVLPAGSAGEALAGPPVGDGSRGFYGKAILYAERDCRAPDTRGWSDRLIRDVPFPGEEIAAGEPVCTLLAQGADPAQCLAALAARAAEVKGELYA
jgi:predicted ATP-grasp superfamily ATP-dependent carboligase